MKRIDPSPCPKCGVQHDAATASDGSGIGPVKGDLSICVDCGSINVFDDDLKLVTITEEQLSEGYDDETLAEIRRVSSMVAGLHAITKMMSRTH